MESIQVSKCTFDRNNIDLSIVVPTYKRAKYLLDAINSIFLQNGSYSINFEVIVVNNEPSDNMDDIIEKFQDKNVIFYINKENYGQVGNINQGILLSKGKYVALLHDDDLLLDNYLKTISPYIDNNAEYDCIIPSYYTFYDKYRLDLKHKILHIIYFYRYFYRRKIQQIYPENCVKSFYDIYNAPTCGTIFLRQALIEYGLFKDEFGAAWDYYNFRKFNINHSIFLLHQFIGARRMYSGMSNSKNVQLDFKRYKEYMLEELQDDPFIKRYSSCIMRKRPLKKYIPFKIRKETYKYSHNLDGLKIIPMHLYKKIIKNV